ncbi:MBL fold metallo-hydrolase [Hydrogenophaga sp.]|uniref:MBL fold metallo-hydrolase n=1 Tax=Hydrogenophaga sp. TaxID=1904254 RepID=UPI003563CA0B
MTSVNMCRQTLISVLAFAATALSSLGPVAHAADTASVEKAGTKVIFLGTGYPRPDPEAMGPSLAIVVRGHAYVVDAGVGVVRRAAAAFAAGETALSSDNLKTVFLTHLHSDHTLGLPDLLLTPWVVGRKAPLKVIGPKGSATMLKNISKAWDQDIHIRLEGGEGGNKTGYKAEVTEIKPGKVYQDENVTVSAFRVGHGTWHEAFGFRFDTPDKSIVISGDTAAAPDVIQKACNGCDILIHEVFAGQGVIENVFVKKDFTHSEANWATYMSKFHTSAKDLGVIAKAAHPKLLLLHHTILLGKATEQEVVRDIKLNFDGRVEVAKDLDAF